MAWVYPYMQTRFRPNLLLHADKIQGLSLLLHADKIQGPSLLLDAD